MPLRISTGVRNAMLGQRGRVTAALVGTDLAFVDGGSGQADSITDSSNRFVSAGFVPGGIVRTYNPTTSGNAGEFVVVGVSAGVLTLLPDVLAQSEAFEADTMLIQATGGSFRDLFRNCVLRVFSGGQPSSADSAETGTVLLELTLDGGSFSGGNFANGLTWGDPSGGIIAKSSDESWKGVGLTNGIMGWFRLYGNDLTTGASTTAMRIDGTVATSGGQLTVATTTVTQGATSSLDAVTLTFPTN